MLKLCLFVRYIILGINKNKMHSDDYLKLNLPFTAMQQHGRKTDHSSYGSFLPEINSNDATSQIFGTINYM